SLDGKEVSAADARGNIHRWDVAGGREVVRLQVGAHDDLAIAFSPDLTQAAVVRPFKTDIQIWSLTTPVRMVGKLKGSSRRDVRNLCWSPAGSMIAAASANEVCVWGAQSHDLIWNSNAGGRHPQGLAWSPDGKRLAADFGKTIQVCEPGRTK